MLGFFRGQGQRGVIESMENPSLSIAQDNQESVVNGAKSFANESFFSLSLQQSL